MATTQSVKAKLAAAGIKVAGKPGRANYTHNGQLVQSHGPNGAEVKQWTPGTIRVNPHVTGGWDHASRTAKREQAYQAVTDALSPFFTLRPAPGFGLLVEDKD